MKRLLLIGMGLGVQIVAGQASSYAQGPDAKYSVTDGPRLKDYESELKKLFPGADKVVERPFLPRTSGGTTFTGLVNRLLGEGSHSALESIDLRRYIYEAYKGDTLLGVAHGSEYENGSHPKVRVDVYYDTDGVIKDMRLSGVPDDVLKKFHSERYLEQFIGRKVEDFEIKRNRRGKISKTGDFLAAYRSPSRDSDAGKFFASLIRSVRYNAAFMDVAFFITKHPNLDNASRRVRVRASSGGPEAYVSSSRVVENAEDGSMILMNGQADQTGKN